MIRLSNKNVATFASLFTGFGGVEIAAKAVGLELAWGIELDPKVAAVANGNLGDHIRVANILDCDPHDFYSPTVLHASPECTRASVAANSNESDLDISLAVKVAEFIRVLQPRYFTLENVWPYRNFRSFDIIRDALKQSAHQVSFWNLNASDYGVPQTRKRMILVASKHKWFARPNPTHYDPVQDGKFSELFGLKPWEGWYKTIEDLIPSLPESEFAYWQTERLLDIYKSFLIGNGTRSAAIEQDRPAETITANRNQGYMRAFLVDGNSCSENNRLTIRNSNEPSFTITSSTASKGALRAFSGKVIQLSPRCIARLQTFLDWYTLPENKTLACKGIGNAVPPLLYQRVLEHILKGEL